jgi:UDP-N-acetylglucosamine 2-epimerase (non-hydrolysing)
MRKMKVMTIVGTRPEIIRLSSVIKECDKQFDHILVHTGQNWDYTLNQVFFDELELREPDYYLESVGSHLGETIGNIISKSYEVLKKEMPDALLVLGDTNSCLSVIPAKRLKIPVFHMEAGNRCFDINVPEEINRKIVDHTADVNLAYTEHSRRYLISEGFPMQYIFVTGSPMTEVLNLYKDSIDNSNVLEELGLEKGKYILISAHREENLDIEGNLEKLVESINFAAEHYNLPVIYSTHPRTKNKIKEKGVVFHKNVRNLKPFGFFDYNNLQQNSFVVLSDSGTLSEESNILKFPGVLIRTSTERPEVLDKGTVLVGGITKRSVYQSIEMARSMEADEYLRAVDYQDQNVSKKVVKIIQSYTQNINKFKWLK